MAHDSVSHSGNPRRKLVLAQDHGDSRIRHTFMFLILFRGVRGISEGMGAHAMCLRRG